MDIYSARFLGMNAIWGSPHELQAESDEAAVSAVARAEQYGQGYEIRQSDRLVARSGSGTRAERSAEAGFERASVRQASPVASAE